MSDDTPYMVVRDFESPKNPWVFTAETGMVIEGQFFSELYQNVLRHYEANGLPRPDREDIEDAACRETNPGPSKCRKRPPKPTAGMRPHLTLHMVERFMLSVWHAFKEKKLVPLEEAKRRYEVCMACPLATSVGGCAGCYGTLKMALKLLGNNPIPDNPEKRVCGACGCLISAKVHVPNSVLDKAEKERPLYEKEVCWRYQPDPP